MRVAELRFVRRFDRRDLKSFPLRLLVFLPDVHVGWKPDITDQDESTDRRLPVLLGHIVVFVNSSVCNSGLGYVL